jgi:hypothetical protein
MTKPGIRLVPGFFFWQRLPSVLLINALAGILTLKTDEIFIRLVPIATAVGSWIDLKFFSQQNKVKNYVWWTVKRSGRQGIVVTVL